MGAEAVHPAPAARIPRATYRLQLHRDFRFADAMALVPYLAGLGISHLYCSPPLRARPGSQHGYDVVNHAELNPELGTRAEFDALVAALHDHGMGLLIDIVPNHMGVLGGDNAWWLDVLENGAASAYADHFDIDWHAADPVLAGRVLLPILGDQYGVVLERGELVLHLDAEAGSFMLRYFEHRLPIDPSAYGLLLRSAQQRLVNRGGGGSGAATIVLQRMANAFDDLPPRTTADPAARAARQRDKNFLKTRLAAMLSEHPALAQAIAQEVAHVNGRAGERASFDVLESLVEAQAYRLAYWRVAGDEINYRRFFDINELAALRMENPRVFDDTHALVLDLAASGAVDGLRIDHPDGLADPAAYFLRLQQAYAERAGRPRPEAPVDGDASQLPLYVVVEKIVAPHEQVPADWAVHGTTGYRFANVVNGLLLDAEARSRLERGWRAFVREEAEDFETLAWQCKHLVMNGSLAGELMVLTNSLRRLARADRRTRDFTLQLLRQALAEVVAWFPVYRTYIVDQPSAQDRKFIEWAIGRARRSSTAADPTVFDFLRRVLLGRPLPGAVAGLGARYRAFARRLQQYTAPVAAKGIEDTAFYRHQRLISVNDVGGEPDAFGMSVAAFHAASRDRAQHWPHTMLATSTHDSKRSEDVRLRINVISEMPTAWRLTVRRWSRMNRSHKRTVDGRPAPTRNDEYMLYQMLAGSFPADGATELQALTDYTGRLCEAMLKAVRESKAITSWIHPNADYEAALTGYIEALLAPNEHNLFLVDLRATTRVFAWYGALNGLSLALIKCLSPGVPDFYQGHEGIVLSLVDPDNRRPVDFGARAGWLEASRAQLADAPHDGALRDLLAHATDARAKFWTLWRALHLRQVHAELLRDGDYLPLALEGLHADHALAFARRANGRCIVAVAGRLYASQGLEVGVPPIGEHWGDTCLVWPSNAGPAPGALEDAINGRPLRFENGRVRLAELLVDFPVAALHGVLAPAA